MNKKIQKPLFLLLLVSLFVVSVSAQNLKRTAFKTENIEFGVGGTVTIIGAPLGSITIEGWNKNEVEISAEVEIEAATEADLTELAKVNGFAIDEQFGHIRIMTVGTHDKEFMKKSAKKFPKRLLGIPFRINYKIKLPTYCDLEINGGKGDIQLSGVEGAIQIKAMEANAVLNLIGGSVSAVIGTGNVDVKIANRSWRGRQAAVQVATGTLNVQFPQNLNAEVNASILRTGQIENTLTTLKPRDRSKFSEKSMLARAGSGGALLSFTVGDGNLKFSNW